MIKAIPAFPLLAFAAIGRLVVGLLAMVGRVTKFALTTIVRAVTPPYYPARLFAQIMEIGWFSLPVVGLTAIFTGSALAQQIFTGVYGLGHYFPLAFAAAATGVAVAGFLNARLVGRIGMRVMSHGALLGYLAVAAIMFVTARSQSLPLPLFMALSTLMMFSFGLMIANFTALAMEPHGHIAGTASSLYGSITTLLGIAIGTVIGQAYDGTLTPFATGFLICTLATLAVVTLTEKGRLFRPHHKAIAS